MLVLSMRWFLEHGDIHSVRPKYEMRLIASGFVIALPSKGKQSDKQQTKQQKMHFNDYLKIVINGSWRLLYS